MYAPCISYEIVRSVKTPVIHYTYICICTHATTYMCDVCVCIIMFVYVRMYVCSVSM